MKFAIVKGKKVVLFVLKEKKKDDKNKEDSPSRTTNNSATCHVQNQLISAVLLQTAAVILENPDTKQQVKVKVLLDADSQRTYISERNRKFLNLSTEAVKDVDISTFGNSQTLSKSIKIFRYKAYNNIFIEQKQNVIIEEVMSPGKLGETHYIPHHPVIRRVFDASARDNGPNLNDCLYKGPHLTPLLYDILLKFRSHVVALTSDIEKAFLQINVNKNDREILDFSGSTIYFQINPKSYVIALLE